MAKRNELLRAREILSELKSSPEKVSKAAHIFKKNGAVKELRILLAGRIELGDVEANTRLLHLEFTMRDVKGLGNAERLNSAKKLLDAERKADKSLPPLFKDLEKVLDKQDALYEAQKIFSKEDKGPGKTLISLAKRLKKYSVFADARELFGEAKGKDDLTRNKKLYARQQEAICTYKDRTMPRARRLDEAIKILQDDLDYKPNAETLGIAGAIYKRKWEVGNNESDLKKSLGYYLAGKEESLQHLPTRPGNTQHKEDPQKIYRNYAWDAGYNAINAAFILDKLALLELDDIKADQLHTEAITLRSALVTQLSSFYNEPLLDEESKNDWWLLVTLVEASWGLALSPLCDEKERNENFKLVEDWSTVAKKQDPPHWEFRSTVTQLIELTQVLNVDLYKDDAISQKALGLLKHFLGKHENGLDNVLRGKLGLALSGGGFRASLFHIGVLAKLAELDVLRRIEVISCVSGGSIIGAHYYLELRKWLHENNDSAVQKKGEINRECYVEIVRRVQEHFLAGVRKNLRVRLATNPKTAFLSLILPGYSRTERLGELYNEHLFSKVEGGESSRPRMLDELLVEPLGTKPMAFVPPRDNWLRFTPVPVLLLNATTLNTGHNWQFTVTWMGESRWSIDDKIDGNARLRRPYFWQAPKKYQKFPLGRAVAASSCVPGLFEPIVLPNLYPGYAVRLVDGGVHDNQGVAGLLEQDCDWLLVSDASGQMTTKPTIGGGSINSYSRMTNILMARVREEQLKNVRAKVENQQCRGAVTVHLREGLEIKPVHWKGYKGKQSDSSDYTSAIGDLHKDILEPLSNIRTDLDSCNDTEAFALMAAGYKMIEAKSEEFVQAGLGSPPVREYEWDFLKIAHSMEDSTNPKHESLKRFLRIGSSLSWKIWRLDPVGSVLMLFPVLLFVIAPILAIGWGGEFLMPGIWLAIVSQWPWAVGAIASLSVVKMISNRLMMGHFFILSALSSTLFSLVLLLMWPVAIIHLQIYDKRYLKLGEVK